MPVLNALADWLFEILATVATAVAGFVADMKRVQRGHGKRLGEVESEIQVDQKQTRIDEIEQRQDAYDRMLQRQERYFTGDEEDPSSPGILEEMHEIAENQQDLRDDVRQIKEELDHER